MNDNTNAARKPSLKHLLLTTLLPLLAACASSPASVRSPAVAGSAPRTAPILDYHQHLVSSAFEPIVKLPARDGAALVRALDEAGIERAVVASMGYSFGDERKGLTNPDGLTRQENDWTAAEVVQNAPRLIGFCSANPLRAAALDELERCLGLSGMVGIKLHLGNSGISLRNPAHIETLRQVFALAQRLEAPILVHMRPRGGTDYGAPEARVFLEQVIPTAPDVEVIIAHLGSSSPGYVAQHHEVLGVFAEAARQNDPRMENIYFDVSANITEQTEPADAALAVERMRDLGLERILYGSDLSAPGGSVAEAWRIFRTKLPLTDAELQQIASNQLRFVRATQ